MFAHIYLGENRGDSLSMANLVRMALSIRGSVPKRSDAEGPDSTTKSRTFFQNLRERKFLGSVLSRGVPKTRAIEVSLHLPHRSSLTEPTGLHGIPTR